MADPSEPKLKFEPVEARVQGIPVSKLLSKDFLALMSKEFENARFITLRFVISTKPVPKAESNTKADDVPSPAEKLELVTLGHYAKEHLDEAILTIDCDLPDTLRKVERVLQQFHEG